MGQTFKHINTPYHKDLSLYNIFILVGVATKSLIVTDINAK